MNARQKSPIRIANTFAIVIASALAAISPLAHADKAITFNVPVKLEKLDPVVNGFFVSCGVFGDGPQIVYKASPTTPISNGAYTGVVMTSLTIPTADLAKVKKWSCTLRLTSPSHGTGIGINVAAYPWTKVAAGAIDAVSGSF